MADLVIMKVKELRLALQGLDDDADVTAIDSEQNNCWNIIECRTTDKDTTYIDLVVEGI